MPPDLFRGLLQVGAIQFALGSVLVQLALFRFARGPSGSPRSPLRALLLALPFGLVPALIAFAIWSPGAWPRVGWDILVGLEILLAFVLLDAGLAGMALRLSEGNSRAKVGPDWRILSLRLGVLVVGWAYAAALAIFVPGGPGETLFTVSILGACFCVLALRRRPRG